MNARIIQLVEDLQKEVSIAGPVGSNIESLREENESLKKQFAHSKQKIIELENKLEALEQENMIINTQKRKLKLVVIKLKHKLESKDKLKSKKTTKGVALKDDVIFVNEESNKSCESEMNGSMPINGKLIKLINNTEVA